MLARYGLNRYLCDVLGEMRKLLEVSTCADNVILTEGAARTLKSLIEEAQVMANRMEAALYDQKDLETLHERIKEKTRELEKLEQKVKDSSEES